uniref:CENPB DNA-binding domain-containing protein 1 n=1 Tax=Pogona vitticeps TaxID=103695 RepID=A0ABM5GL52_9SAUR
MKKEILRKYDGGKCIMDISREYDRNPSTIGTIVAMREKILATDAAKGVTRIAKNRPAVLEEVEKLLVIWMQEKQLAGDTVTEAVICEKARALYEDLVQQQPGTSAEPEEFKASRGWFECFKTRSSIHSKVRHGEAATSDVTAAEEFATEFLEVVMTEGGDLKIKPLLVYQSKNPWAFKKHKVDKARLRDDLLQEFSFIKITFLPPNTTPVLQPMDQQVIANFKKRYTKELFRQCFKVTKATHLTLREFWKEHFDIVTCLKLIAMAWDDISQRNLNSGQTVLLLVFLRLHQSPQ